VIPQVEDKRVKDMEEEKKDITVYKVVVDCGGDWKSAIVHDIPGVCVCYELGSVSKARSEQGPLMAFDSLDAAVEFACACACVPGGTVLECSAKLSEHNPPYLLHVYYAFASRSSNTTEFWKSVFDGSLPEMKNKNRHADLPHGTVFCDEITPLRVVG
jgi:hypothetical protein